MAGSDQASASPVEHLLEDPFAADAVGEVLDVHQLGPHALTGQGDRGDVRRDEGLHGGHQLGPGGGRGDAVLLEELGAVVQDHRLGVVVRDAVLLPVDLADLRDRLDRVREDVVDLAGEVHDRFVADVVLQRAAGPVEDQGRRIARSRSRCGSSPCRSRWRRTPRRRGCRGSPRPRRRRTPGRCPRLAPVRAQTDRLDGEPPPPAGFLPPLQALRVTRAGYGDTEAGEGCTAGDRLHCCSSSQVRRQRRKDFGNFCRGCHGMPGPTC